MGQTNEAKQNAAAVDEIFAEKQRKYRVVAVMDDQTCDTCRAANGKIVTDFPDCEHNKMKGMRHCRCVLEDVVEPTAEVRTNPEPSECFHDGHALWNSDTHLGRALRQYYPGFVKDVTIKIAVDCIEVVVTEQLPRDLVDCPEWTELLGLMEEYGCVLKQTLRTHENKKAWNDGTCAENYTIESTSLVADSKADLLKALEAIVGSLKKNKKG